MDDLVSAGDPLEPQAFLVGRRSATVSDTDRGGRELAVDCWFPVDPHVDVADFATSVYELLPGVGFTASALVDAPPSMKSCPLVVWSHGRTGTRAAYVMLCEGLAARGYIVIASDHPGDTLMDWMTGAAVDDATNERQRVEDVTYLLDCVSGMRSECGSLLSEIVVDDDRIAVAGHSYGGNTALRYAVSEQRDGRVRAIAGLQAFTRTISRSELGSVSVPTLLIAGANDTTCPVGSDAHRAFEALVGAPHVACTVIAAAGHQACSDVGLYRELAPQVPNLPDVVVQYLSGLGNDVTGNAVDPWRPSVALHLELLGSWLDEVLHLNSDRDRFALAAQQPAVSEYRRRG